ncbi:hypothetical protein Sjap_022377 [Stephania japonica]|uniref:Carboxypeptidase n=1 Tax=Stephania japonica TaxID=461633 RepID=A0AAP0ENS9_9MAGN
MSNNDHFTIIIITCLLLSVCLINVGHANQMDNLERLIKSKRSGMPPGGGSSAVRGPSWNSPVYVGQSVGSMQDDLIGALPGEPSDGVDFNQYSGYVTVDPKAGRALFYYFAESQNSSRDPLVLWLNGGPGCSSLGYGAMEELGPFRVNSDGKTLYRNNYAWNNVANVIFLESPAGVGFSYSNTSSDYNKNGDTRTALDAYVFLLNWLERFPQYKTRDFYITGESYAGHYVPQLASLILNYNKFTNYTINLKGIAIGNAWIDDVTGVQGQYDYFWTHGLSSDETNAAIHKYCNFSSDNSTKECYDALDQASNEIGHLDIYNIYAPLCHNTRSNPQNGKTGSIHDFDPCTDDYVFNYLNLAEVQAALHVIPTKWFSCRFFPWSDRPVTVLPTVQQLVSSGIRVWIYSGDIDGRVPVTSSRYSINTFQLPIEKPWRPWYTNQEVGGYVVKYKGLTFVTVRGAGHTVPSYQPERALTLISSFLLGQLPPSA